MPTLPHDSALLLVDLQNDFCEGGALAVPDAGKVIPIANVMQPYFSRVVASLDWHPSDHSSFASNNPGATIGQVITLNDVAQIMWPNHCVQETTGAAFHPALQLDLIHHITRKGMDKTIDSYSAFFDNAHHASTGLHDYLQASDIQHLYIMGLATDYCVKFTVLDALRLGYAVTVIEDGCRGVGLSTEDIPGAIAEMKAAGAIFSDHSQVISSCGSFK